MARGRDEVGTPKEVESGIEFELYYCKFEVE